MFAGGNVLNVTFRKKNLRKRYENSAEAMKVYGDEVGRRYIQRVNILKNSADKAAVMAQRPLRCHPLTGDRKGQYAITLINRWRLIVTFDKGINVVQIEEVSKHYDD